VPRSLADLQLYRSECQTEKALTPNAFADNPNAVRGTETNYLSGDRNLYLADDL